MFFFFQAEDGIRDLTVTGVQTCALPIRSMIQAEDGIRDLTVTGVQTCALPICLDESEATPTLLGRDAVELVREKVGCACLEERAELPLFSLDRFQEVLLEKCGEEGLGKEIGRASCRERV